MAAASAALEGKGADDGTDASTPPVLFASFAPDPRPTALGSLPPPPPALLLPVPSLLQALLNALLLKVIPPPLRSLRLPTLPAYAITPALLLPPVRTLAPVSG